MRFGTRRALTLALSAAALGLGLGTTAQAQTFWPVHTIPRVSPAYDYTTGGEFMAPPVPYGHYAKDYVGAAHKHAAMLKGHLLGKFAGHGLGHHGDGDGDGDGCTGPGCGSGHGAFGHDGGSGCSEPGCFNGISCGILGHHNSGGSWTSTRGYATTMSGASAQCRPDPIRTDGLRADRLRRSAANTRILASEVIRVPASAATQVAASAPPHGHGRTETAAAGSAAARAASIASAMADTAR